MKKKVLLMAMAGALCCGMGISRADGAPPYYAPEAPPPLSNTPNLAALHYQIASSSTAAVSAISIAERQAGFSAPQNPQNQEYAYSILTAYRRIVQDSPAADARIRTIMLRYYGLKYGNGANSTLQISQAANETAVELSLMQTAQNQQLIDQNNKIIDLLTQLVHKK